MYSCLQQCLQHTEQSSNSMQCHAVLKAIYIPMTRINGSSNDNIYIQNYIYPIIIIIIITLIVFSNVHQEGDTIIAYDGLWIIHYST